MTEIQMETLFEGWEPPEAEPDPLDAARHIPHDEEGSA